MVPKFFLLCPQEKKKRSEHIFEWTTPLRHKQMCKKLNWLHTFDANVCVSCGCCWFELPPCKSWDTPNQASHTWEGRMACVMFSSLWVGIVCLAHEVRERLNGSKYECVVYLEASVSLRHRSLPPLWPSKGRTGPVKDETVIKKSIIYKTYYIQWGP